MCVVIPVTASVPAKVTADVALEKEEVPPPCIIKFPVTVVLPWVTTSPKFVTVGIFYLNTTLNYASVEFGNKFVLTYSYSKLNGGCVIWLEVMP